MGLGWWRGCKWWPRTRLPCPVMMRFPTFHTSPHFSPTPPLSSAAQEVELLRADLGRMAAADEAAKVTVRAADDRARAAELVCLDVRRQCDQVGGDAGRGGGGRGVGGACGVGVAGYRNVSGRGVVAPESPLGMMGGGVPGGGAGGSVCSFILPNPLPCERSSRE